MRKIACIGWGSGGHILPIVILCESLRDTPNVKTVWIGEQGGMDEKKAQEHGIDFFWIPGVKFRRHLSYKTLFQPFSFLFACFRAWKVLKQTSPDVIFCKWGWVALSVGICAWLQGIPLYAHESDTIPGMTNRVIGWFAKKVFVWFPSAAAYFRAPTESVWQWIDPIFLEYKAKHPFHAQALTSPMPEAMHVVVQCGWLWSTRIFRELLRILPEFPNVHFTIALGTLNEHFLEDFSAYPNVFVKKWFFHEELAEAYARADVAIVRSAANTLGECEYFWLKMIMIPLGISSFNHQYYNAREYSLGGRHVLLPETNISELSNTLREIWAYRKESYDMPQTLSHTALNRIRAVLLWEPDHRVQ